VSPVSGHTVLVGIDGTEDGRRALRYAVVEARRRGDALRLLHVTHETMMVAPMMPYIPEPTVRDVASTMLEQAEGRAIGWGLDPTELSTVLSQAPRAAAFMENLEDVSCIVLGTRGSRARRLLTGSTTTSVAAHSPVPVHCVAPSWDGDRDELGRVVVGVDGSDITNDVLDGAFAEARCRGAHLEIVHAWEPAGEYDAAITRRTLEQDWDQAARSFLTKTIEEVAGPDPGVAWTLSLQFHRPVAALHDAAAAADLLIVGRRGRWGPFKLSLGSTTRTLLRTATCPVMVTPVPRHPGEDAAGGGSR